MKKITIDARQCGAGKTTDPHNGIYARINYNIQFRQPTLLVVGSLNLQQQYYKKYKNQLELIYSANDSTSTVTRCLNSMSNNKLLICITHQCFKLLPYSELRENYDLIIDETLSNIYDEITVQIKDNDRVEYKWDKHFEIGTRDKEFMDIELQKSTICNNKFYKLTSLGGSDDSIANSKLYRQITDPNFDYYITPFNYNIMMGNQINNKMFHVHCLLNDRLFQKWASIHIAAAAFDKTALYHLFNYYEMPMEFITKFEPHKGNIKLHTCSNSKFKWSNTKRLNNTDILDQFYRYIESVTSNNVLSLKNNNEKNKLENSIDLTHNVHGINAKEYHDCTDIAMASALLPSKSMASFLKQTLLSHIGDKKEKVLETRNQQNIALTHFYATYLFYQAIMRCKLRQRDYNNELINIFVLDNSTGVAIADYFDLGDDGSSNILFDLDLSNTNIDKKTPLSKSEQNKRAYLKRKQSKINGNK